MTGADGEQMVLSGPEAAALLAQAGISLGEQEQVGGHCPSLQIFQQIKKMLTYDAMVSKSRACCCLPVQFFFRDNKSTKQSNINHFR